MSHPKDDASWVGVLLLKDTVNRCHDWDLKPHSADQKHQNLSPVLFTARPLIHTWQLRNVELEWLQRGPLDYVGMLHVREISTLFAPLIVFCLLMVK